MRISILLHGFAALFILLLIRSKPQPVHANLAEVSVLKSSHPLVTQAKAHLEVRKDSPGPAITHPEESSPSGTQSESAEYENLIRDAIIAHQHYPIEARRRKQAGRVEVHFEIDERGQLLQLEAHSVDQFELLENAARDAVMTAAPFVAPKTGQPRSFRIPIFFELQP